jgi:hypothetical protein
MTVGIAIKAKAVSNMLMTMSWDQYAAGSRLKMYT